MSANDGGSRWIAVLLGALWRPIANRRIFVAMIRVTCNCGAIYEVMETKGPARDPSPFKCVLCEKEMIAWEGSDVGQFRLVWRPDDDRE